jgi:hypothetical protein
VVKKPVKRGRPRKDRPNSEDRADKANKTRARVAAGSNTRSQSVESEDEDEEEEEMASQQNSPLVFDNLDMSPIQQENMINFGEQSEQGHHSALELPACFAPSVFSHTPPCSPYSTGNKPSPEHITMSDFGGSRPSTAGEQDSAMGSDTKDSLLFSIGEKKIIDDMPELCHSPPSIGMDDVEFNANGNFNNSELSNSTGFFNQSLAGNFGQSLSGGFGQSLSGDFGRPLSGGFGQSLSGSLFGGSMFQTVAQDSSWEPDFLNDNNDEKSFHMFEDQAQFTETD